mgnify:FL=1
MPRGFFHRSECQDCVIPSNNASAILQRLYTNALSFNQSRLYTVGLCDTSGVCHCIRPYVADTTCHHVFSKYGNVSKSTYLGTQYGIWLPVYMFCFIGCLYLLSDKCSAQRHRSSNRSKNKYNKRQTKPATWSCHCNVTILIMSLVAIGLLLRGVTFFVDPMNIFHMLPQTLSDLSLSVGTSCWLAAALFTVQCFVQSTRVALRLRGAMKGAWKLKYATIAGAALLAIWGVLTDLIFRFVAHFSDAFLFMSSFRVLVEGVICLVLMALALYWGHRAVALLGHNQRLFRPNSTIDNSTSSTSRTPKVKTNLFRNIAQRVIQKKQRTRRQQIVNTWIIHLRLMAVFVFLLFLTIIVYSLMGVGDIDSR